MDAHTCSTSYHRWREEGNNEKASGGVHLDDDDALRVEETSADNKGFAGQLNSDGKERHLDKRVTLGEDEYGFERKRQLGDRDS